MKEWLRLSNTAGDQKEKNNMANLIYGSSLSDPRYANYGGAGLLPQSSLTNPWAANYQGRQTSGVPVPNVSASPHPQALGLSSFPADQYKGWDAESAQRDWEAKQRGEGVVGANDNQSRTWEEQQRSLEQERARLELEQTLSAFDKSVEEAKSQKGWLGQEVEKQVGRLGEGYESAKKRAGGLKEEAESATSRAKETALSTAQDVVRKNRNVLRALGILSSSAAGEMLSRPIEEYATQAADLGAQLLKRKDEVENWLSERMVEYDNAVKDVQDNYTRIVEQIDRDIRFTERDKINAVKEAQTALKQSLSEISNRAVAYQQAADEYNNNLVTQIAQLQRYEDPNANISGILSQAVLPGQQQRYSSTASLYLGKRDEDEQKGLA